MSLRGDLQGQPDGGVEAFVSEVRALVEERLAAVVERVGLPPDCLEGAAGKMLRSRLGGRLASCGAASELGRTPVVGCAAVELLHTATLCHDDVIDRSSLRRFRPTLWRATNTTAAILVGDLLLTESLVILQEHGDSSAVGSFLGKIGEVCASELEVEFRHRGRPLDRETWLRLGRAKTGALFAFAARSCGGGDVELAAGLEEAGYRVGTAYQVIDDLVDVLGEARNAGKDVGRDAQVGVLTRLVSDAEPARVAAEELREQCRQALAVLAPWPLARKAVASFLDQDMEPLLRRAVPDWSEPLTPSA